MSVAGVVLARDEEQHLEGCLATLTWADEILVVVDAASTDSTARIARRYTERVETVPWRGYGDQRNAALEMVRSDWVFFVDADERVVPALAAEVRGALAVGAETSGFWVPRRNVIAGRWVRHAGWWPDHQLRLLRRGRAHYDKSTEVHEVAAVEGATARLTQPLLHLNYETLRELRVKQRRFARLEARTLFHRGERVRPRNLVLQPLREFRRRLIDLRGYREGLLGFQLSALLAEATLMTYWELRRLSSAVGHLPPPTATGRTGRSR